MRGNFLLKLDIKANHPFKSSISIVIGIGKAFELSIEAQKYILSKLSCDHFHIFLCKCREIALAETFDSGADIRSQSGGRFGIDHAGQHINQGISLESDTVQQCRIFRRNLVSVHILIGCVSGGGLHFRRLWFTIFRGDNRRSRGGIFFRHGCFNKLSRHGVELIIQRSHTRRGLRWSHRQIFCENRRQQ